MITPDMTIAEVMRMDPEVAPVFLSYGMHCLYCPVSSAESIARKLRGLGEEVSVQSMQEHLSDIAGIRVLCAYIDDIYEIARMLAQQKDVRILTVKDYIKNPKANGYRSYHMIVEIPVSFSDAVTSGRRWTTTCSIKSRWRIRRRSCANCASARTSSTRRTKR